jgi:hypothetical protein
VRSFPLGARLVWRLQTGLTQSHMPQKIVTAETGKLPGLQIGPIALTWPIQIRGWNLIIVWPFKIVRRRSFTSPDFAL